jgi:hypothetical protein
VAAKGSEIETVSLPADVRRDRPDARRALAPRVYATGLDSWVRGGRTAAMKEGRDDGRSAPC